MSRAPTSHGVHAAAWLLRQPKSKFAIHMRGVHEVYLPAGVRMPQWLGRALQELRRRPSRWQVEQWTTSDRITRVHIRWRGWRVYSRRWPL